MHIVLSESWNYFLSHFLYFLIRLFSSPNTTEMYIGSMYFLPATPPTVLGQSFSNFIGALRMVWRYAYCFFRILKFFFYHNFCIFNLDFFRALILQKCIGSMYLLPATPPTVLGQSFSNFTGAFRMVWRYAYCFVRILKLFFITFFAFLAHLSWRLKVSFYDYSPSVVIGVVRMSVRPSTIFKQHLLLNHWLHFDQTSQEWSLVGSLSKLFKWFLGHRS